MQSRVTIKIFGQEYTIAGDKSEEEIKKIAEYVDNKMRLISAASLNPAKGGIAILSAVNIAEEYFDALAEIEQLRTANSQMEKDSKYYEKMWDDAKKSYQQYQENINDLKNKNKEKESYYKELEAKCAEYESSFFDLQMENIQLKSELEKLKNNG